MSCICGHHHPGRPHDAAADGSPVALARPMVALEGRLICADAAQMMTALAMLPEHVDLSRAEAGCLRFDVWQDDDPLVWNLAELFRDADAFDAHQARTAASDWGKGSTALRRDFARREVMPVIRPETRADHDAIDALHRAAFGGNAEARLVRDLRAAGDLAVSLVAAAGGAVLGHLALSPLTGDHPALALAPLSVAPGAQGLGIGGALIGAIFERAEATPIVVLGDPGYYGRLGFRPARLQSPYAGPALQVLGELPAGSVIRHAPAFDML